MILITGSSGFVGSCLVRRLTAAGLAVRGFARRPTKTREAGLPKIALAAGSVRDPASLDLAMEGVGRVIHLVGILTESGRDTFEAIHHQGTRNVVDAALRAGVERFIHVSALGTRPGAASRYHQTKWAAEEYVRHSGLDYTILRPSVIFGPHDAFTNLFARILRFSPVLPILGDGRALLQPIAVEDVAHCIQNALGNPDTIGRTYELGGPERIPFQELLEIIARTLGKTPRPLHLPMPLLRLEAAVLERLLPRPPLTTDQLIMAQEDNICDIDPMERTFGLVPRDFREGIREFLPGAKPL
ncbi:MAG: complex I NDUFA9 subunit family protein [Magnetococcales bacterium]|nr:complex I NDUFA9 subunit family protein [Magnetococcales bacterium]